MTPTRAEDSQWTIPSLAAAALSEPCSVTRMGFLTGATHVKKVAILPKLTITMEFIVLDANLLLTFDWGEVTTCSPQTAPLSFCWTVRT